MAQAQSIFVRACRREPVPHTPVWLMRQAGRYMPEYRAVRKHHSILDICHTPALASEVTITAAEILGVDAAIIFADLLLPLEPLGVPFRFETGEGPVIERPLRTTADIDALRTDRTAELGYVSESITLVNKHFRNKVPVIGFCGAPFTLASYMIEGGSSRNYLETKRMMYGDFGAWAELMQKLVRALRDYAAQQIAAGAAAFQIFDSWVGCLSVDDFRSYVLPFVTELVQSIKATGVPVIYFGTDTATLLPHMVSTGADVIGVDWRIQLDTAWNALNYGCAIQGNMDPVLLFAPQEKMFTEAGKIMARAAGIPGHIFNLGHGILPHTPVENVKALVDFVHQNSTHQETRAAR